MRAGRSSVENYNKLMEKRKMLESLTELRGDAVVELSGQLRKLLADVFTLYVKTKNFHWHMTGPHFRAKPSEPFLKRKWEKELEYRLMKELWCFTGDRISVRSEYEWHDANGQWYRTHGNEHWEFDDEGLMRLRDMSANDYPIKEPDRRYRW